MPYSACFLTALDDGLGAFRDQSEHDLLIYSCKIKSAYFICRELEFFLQFEVIPSVFIDRCRSVSVKSDKT
jgi:hypothetical protein